LKNAAEAQRAVLCELVSCVNGTHSIGVDNSV